MATRKPIKFEAIPDGDLRCRAQVMDVYGKKVPGCTFKLQIEQSQFHTLETLEGFCDGNPFKLIINDPAQDLQVSFNTKNDYEFTCDSRKSDSGDVTTRFVVLPVSCSRRELTDIGKLWDVLLASLIEVTLTPVQLPLPLDEGDEDSGEDESVEEDFADGAGDQKKTDKKGTKPGKSGKGRK